MKTLVTLRIYFEYGQKIKGLSLKQKLFKADFATELIKRAKSFKIHQALHFNVSKGYLQSENINWEKTETKSLKHPHMVELTDTSEKIDAFIAAEKELLETTTVLLIKKSVVEKL